MFFNQLCIDEDEAPWSSLSPLKRLFKRVDRFNSAAGEKSAKAEGGELDFLGNLVDEENNHRLALLHEMIPGIEAVQLTEMVVSGGALPVVHAAFRDPTSVYESARR